jgi:hypothetical protein
MKHASLAKDAVYLVNPIPPVEWIDVGLGREKQLPGGIRVLAKDGLAANDDDLLIASDIGSRADDVL